LFLVDATDLQVETGRARFVSERSGFALVLDDQLLPFRSFFRDLRFERRIVARFSHRKERRQLGRIDRDGDVACDRLHRLARFFDRDVELVHAVAVRGGANFGRAHVGRALRSLRLQILAFWHRKAGLTRSSNRRRVSPPRPSYNLRHHRCVRVGGRV
jgi:hypothetical protein